MPVSTTTGWPPTTRCSTFDQSPAHGFIELGVCQPDGCTLRTNVMAEGRTGEWPVGQPVRGATGRGHGGTVPPTHFDWSLALYDIARARHAAALSRAGLLDDSTYAALIAGLGDVGYQGSPRGTFVPASSDEDVHGALERRLVEITGRTSGDACGLGAANDQGRDGSEAAPCSTCRTVWAGTGGVVRRAARPSRTSPRRSGPGFASAARAAGHVGPRDRQASSRSSRISRLADWHERTSVSPMGAGALAATALASTPWRRRRSWASQPVSRTRSTP